jgi:hypothetical protein
MQKGIEMRMSKRHNRITKEIRAAMNAPAITYYDKKGVCHCKRYAPSKAGEVVDLSPETGGRQRED